MSMQSECIGSVFLACNGSISKKVSPLLTLFVIIELYFTFLGPRNDFEGEEYNNQV